MPAFPMRQHQWTPKIWQTTNSGSGTSQAPSASDVASEAYIHGVMVLSKEGNKDYNLTDREHKALSNRDRLDNLGTIKSDLHMTGANK